MRREFDVEARVGQPRVAYREAITKPVRVEGRFVRQTGGHGQYGHVWLELEPQERGAGAEFVDGITGGTIPRNFIPAVEAGVKQALDNGPLAGYPLVDLKVTLVDGSYHTVDSSEMAFRSAAMMAMRDGTRRAAPVLQEPFFEMEIVTPGEFLSEVLSDLGGRRAQIRSIEGQDDLQTVSAMIPLGETFAYTTALRSLTRGAGRPTQWSSGTTNRCRRTCYARWQTSDQRAAPVTGRRANIRIGEEIGLHHGCQAANADNFEGVRPQGAGPVPARRLWTPPS